MYLESCPSAFPRRSRLCQVAGKKSAIAAGDEDEQADGAEGVRPTGAGHGQQANAGDQRCGRQSRALRAVVNQQESEHGQHTTMPAAGLGQAELEEDLLDMSFDRRLFAKAVELASLTTGTVHALAVEGPLPAYAATIGEVEEVKREKGAFFGALCARAREQAEAAGVPRWPRRILVYPWARPPSLDHNECDR